MGYNIKGDLMVGRDIDARVASMSGVDLKSISETAVTGGNFGVDFSAGARYFSYLIDNTSTGLIGLPAPLIVPASVSECRFTFTNTDVVDRTVTSHNDYTATDGVPFGNIVIPVGSSRTMIFAKTTNGWGILSDTMADTGGLPQNGILPASISTQGIYLADGTNMASVLPPATGSQSRVIITTNVSGIGTVIAVTSGQTLNGTTDGNYIMGGNGEFVIFFDNGVAEWTAQLVGASNQTPLAHGRMELNGTQGIAGSIGAITMSIGGFSRAVLPFSQLTHSSGGMAVTVGTFVDNDLASQVVDGTNTVSSMIVPRSGDYAVTLTVPAGGVSVNSDNRPIIGVAVNGAMKKSYNIHDLQLSASNDDQDKFISDVITFTAGDMVQAAYTTEGSIADTWGYRDPLVISDVDGNGVVYSYFDIRELPSTSNVMAGMLTATPLSDMEVGLSANAPGTDCPFDAVLSSSGGLSLVGGKIVINASGRYRIDAYAELLTVNQGIEIHINGVVVQTFVDGSIQNRFKPILRDLQIGDTVGIFTATSATWLGGSISGTTDTNYARLLVQQIPQSTVIDPGAVVVNDISASGEFTVGDKHELWGRATTSVAGAVSVVFQTPFGSAPVVTGNAELAAPASTNRAVMFSNVTAFGFNVMAVTGSGGYSAETVMWRAVGVK